MFQTLLIQPIYNAFIYLIDFMPGGDVGFAIIALTLVIRIVFYPAFASSIRTQMGMQAIQGEVDVINKEYKNNPEERAKRTMALFTKHKVRPLSGFLALLVQLPVFIALYYAFFREGLPKVATNLLYSFVPEPHTINVVFLGVVDLLSKHNILLTVVVFSLQFAVAYVSLLRVKKVSKSAALSPEKESAQRLQQQMMLYFLPVLIGVISYSLPAAVGIYFCAGNVVSLGQEWVIRRQLEAAKN